jgi:hypothetical protein
MDILQRRDFHQNIPNIKTSTLKSCAQTAGFSVEAALLSLAILVGTGAWPLDGLGITNFKFFCIFYLNWIFFIKWIFNSFHKRGFG